MSDLADNGQGEGTNPRIRSAILQLDALSAAPPAEGSPAPGDEDKTEFAEQLAAHLIKLGGGGSDGGGKLSPAMRRLLVALLLLVVGPGGVVGAYYALRDDVDDAVEHIEQPMHKGAAEQFEALDDRLHGVEDKVGDVAEGQTQILESLDSPLQILVFAQEFDFPRYRDQLAEYEYTSSQVSLEFVDVDRDRKSTRLNSSHSQQSRMPSSA